MKQKKRATASVEVLAPIPMARVSSSTRIAKQTVKREALTGRATFQQSEAKRKVQISHLHDRGTDKLLAALRALDAASGVRTDQQ